MSHKAKAYGINFKDEIQKSHEWPLKMFHFFLSKHKRFHAVSTF